MRTLYSFLWRTITKSIADDISKEAAALAYFAVFSMIPVIALLVLVAGAFVSEALIQQTISGFAVQQLGTAAGDFTSKVVRSVTSLSGSIPFFVVTIVVTIYGAYFMFDHLRKAFFAIFSLHIRAKNTLTETVKLQGVSLFYMVLLFIAVYLLIFLHAVSDVAIRMLAPLIPDAVPGAVWNQLGTLAVFVLLVLLFTLIFRLMSLRHAGWRASLIGGAVFSVLFVLGSMLFQLYISLSATLTLFGAASVLVAFLLWTYYMGLVLFYSAEVVDVYEHWVSDGQLGRVHQELDK